MHATQPLARSTGSLRRPQRDPALVQVIAKLEENTGPSAWPWRSCWG